MMKQISLVPAICLGLAACGSGSNAPSGPPSGTTYEPVSNILTGGGNGATATGTADLSGVVIRSNATSGQLVLLTVSGEIDFDTGQITLDDGTYELIDPDGTNANGVLTDGSATIATADALGFSGDYDYVFAFEENYSDGTDNFDSSGFAGIVTLAADIPGTGSASYSGETSAVVITSSAGFDLVGSSDFAADFTAKTVDVTLNGFTATDQVSGLPASAPLDEIKITGMTISGNTFVDGTLKTTLNGSDVNITGNPTTTSSSGTFFGYDDDASAPDEVGVSLLSKGADGLIIATALAD